MIVLRSFLHFSNLFINFYHSIRFYFYQYISLFGIKEVVD